MTIKGDVGEILFFMYDCYVNDKGSVNPEKLLETTFGFEVNLGLLKFSWSAFEK